MSTTLCIFLLGFSGTICSATAIQSGWGRTSMAERQGRERLFFKSKAHKVDLGVDVNFKAGPVKVSLDVDEAIKRAHGRGRSSRKMLTFLKGDSSEAYYDAVHGGSSGAAGKAAAAAAVSVGQTQAMIQSGTGGGIVVTTSTPVYVTNPITINVPSSGGNGEGGSGFLHKAITAISGASLLSGAGLGAGAVVLGTMIPGGVIKP